MFIRERMLEGVYFLIEYKYGKVKNINIESVKRIYVCKVLKE